MISHTFTITCDRSGQDGIVCMSLGAPTARSVEEMAASNGWISGDGYHECPRHQGRPTERFIASGTGTYTFTGTRVVLG